MLLVTEHNTVDMKGFSLMFSPGRIKRVLCLSKVKNIGCSVSLFSFEPRHIDFSSLGEMKGWKVLSIGRGE